MAAELRPPHLLPGDGTGGGGRLLFETPLESWQEAVDHGRGRLLSPDKIAALVLAFAVVFAQVGLGVGTATAASTFTVNSTADVVDANPGNGLCDTGNLVGSDPECTLRAAVQEANALAGTDTINLPAGTYTLTIGGTGEDVAATGDLDITADVTITGAGSG
jgi:CSLREA domain-containing protein